MVLSESKKFLFIHIPKTAGTSVQHVLDPYGVTDFLACTRGIESYIAEKRQIPPHLSYIEAADIITVDLKRHFKFAFVRNPWDRYVSLYEYFRKDTNHAMHQRCRSCSFADFIDDVVSGRATFDTRNQALYVAWPTHLGPVDFIGRMENIQSDFAHVCSKIGIGRTELPVLNTTDHKSYRSYYSDELRKKIEQFSRQDIQMFGYKF